MELWPYLEPYQLEEILEVEGLRPIFPIKGDPGPSIASLSDVIQRVPDTTGVKIGAESFNPIFLCRSATMSNDGRYLVAPDGKSWTYGGQASSHLLLVR